MNMLKSLVLNSVSLSSIYVFDLLLAPLIKENAHWTHRHFGWFYQVLWLFPVVGVSLYLNVREYRGRSMIADHVVVLNHSEFLVRGDSQADIHDTTRPTSCTSLVIQRNVNDDSNLGVSCRYGRHV